KYQGKGYGKKLIEYVVEFYEDECDTLLVGTGDSDLTIPFYRRCGFEESHRIKNFFTDNYDHPIYECGKQLVDMVYLKRIYKR
ncbi:MAG TPA: GNAT family N-acetyltransferase, partial [Lachnospiraceae bacterium]|nr:GNAT family N-acetyltransferase [Lachnospiraceae bacterium]